MSKVNFIIPEFLTTDVSNIRYDFWNLTIGGLLTFMAWISDIKDKNEKYLMGNNEHSVGLKKECYRKNGNLFTSEKLRI